MKRRLFPVVFALAVSLIAALAPATSALAFTYPAKITGRVTHEATGLAEATVLACDSASGVVIGYADADANGYYALTSLTTPQTTVKLLFRDDRGRYLSSWWDSTPDFRAATAVPASADTTTVCDQDLVSGGTVQGTVALTPAYTPQLGAATYSWTARLWRKSGPGWVLAYENAAAEITSPVYYRFLRVWPGTYRLSVASMDAVSQVWPSAVATSVDVAGATDIAVGAGELKQRELSMTRGGHLVGSVIGPGNKYVPARVNVYTAGTAGLARSFVAGRSLSGGPFVMGDVMRRAGQTYPVLTSAGDYVVRVEPADPDLMPFWVGGGTTKFDAKPLHVADATDTSLPLRIARWAFTLTTPTCASTVARKAPLLVTGAILPLQPAGQRGVVLTLDHREHARWVYKASVATGPTKAGIYRRYTVPIRFGLSGEWRIRAKHRDASHPRTVYSAGYGYVTVR